MKINHFIVASFAVAAIGFSGTAHSAVLPMKIPVLPLTPSYSAPAVLAADASLKSVPLPVLPSAPILPSMPAPVNGPVALPGATVPLPLSLPAELNIRHEFPDHEIHLDWSFLDRDDDAAGALVESAPKPKPLAPRGAAAQLAKAAKAARTARPVIRIGSDELFDNSRQLVTLP